MKTKSDKIFNIIKWVPIVVFGMGVVLNIISGDYDAAVLNLCLIVMCWLILSLLSDLENTMELAAEDMLRVFNNVDKMYKKYGDNN